MDHQITDEMTSDEASYVRRKLVEFADQFTPPRNQRMLSVALRDKNGNVMGGITANTIWDWLQIGVLWLPDELRGQGFGHQLLERIETIGRDKGCKHAMLNTFEFEAREFYESHGYEVESQTNDFPEGHTQYHLRKEL
ncbi:MAG: GNAT family N-acetyltransferase [Pseudomonadaceae bacterium]|nr:GNAT family N-acetyltransferase [Pseudomonadaceae bacterium]